jgi:hypothetical protein
MVDDFDGTVIGGEDNMKILWLICNRVVVGKKLAENLQAERTAYPCSILGWAI